MALVGSIALRSSTGVLGSRLCILSKYQQIRYEDELASWLQISNMHREFHMLAGHETRHLLLPSLLQTQGISCREYGIHRNASGTPRIVC